MTTFTFNSRDTYLAWRAEWKQQYFATAEAIRAARNSIKNAHRENGSANYSDYRTLFASIRKANELLDTLAEAKLEAGRQYNAKKELQHG